MVRGTVTDWTEYCQNKLSLFRRSEPGNEYELWEGLAMFLYLGKRMLTCTFSHIGNFDIDSTKSIQIHIIGPTTPLLKSVKPINI